MASFVLVHGSWHGAWCWQKLVPRLRDAGHEVVAIDLPAHGDDRRSPFFVSQASYSRAVQDAANECARRPILVGHSMGGMAITRAALDAPGQAAALIYLSAFVPIPGESLIALGRRDPTSLVFESTRVGLRGIHVVPHKAARVFYHHCSEEDAAWATARLCPDPWWPMMQKLPGKGVPILPRGYIECTEDRAVSIQRQRAMSSRTPFDEIATLETDHSPFLSAPDELVRILDRMSKLGG